MRTPPARLLVAALLIWPCATALAQPGVVAEERMKAAFVLAFGRVPSATEIEQLHAPANATVRDLFEQHRARLSGDDAARRAVAIRAAQDAFGREPASAELNTATAAASTYVERVQQHIRQLEENPAEYRQVIQRAYQRVLRRDPYELEFDYWKTRPTLSYVLLVGSVENWALRNAPGLMATTGTPTVSINSTHLTTLRLSSVVAVEARIASGLDAASGAEMSAATGRTIVAAGAADVLSLGRIHFAVVGKSGS